MSPITTHVLDTSQGCPGVNIMVRLEQQKSDKRWREISSGTTDNDGRIVNLLAEEDVLDLSLIHI